MDYKKIGYTLLFTAIFMSLYVILVTYIPKHISFFAPYPNTILIPYVTCIAMGLHYYLTRNLRTTALVFLGTIAISSAIVEAYMLFPEHKQMISCVFQGIAWAFLIGNYVYRRKQS